MPRYVGLAVLADVNDGTVFRVELTYRVVSRYAAVLAEGNDDFILKYGFGVNGNRLLRRWRSVSLCVYVYTHNHVYVYAYFMLAKM